jgi:hypothetical protein
MRKSIGIGILAFGFVLSSLALACGGDKHADWDKTEGSKAKCSMHAKCKTKQGLKQASSKKKASDQGQAPSAEKEAAKG